MLADIPAPEVMNPDRVSRDDREDMTAEDHRTQKQLLAKALGETCAYAEQLWRNGAAMRQYLYDTLPHETPEDGAVVSTAPHGPGDEPGWQRWQLAFGSITSVLCGPHGDSGFGSQDAAVLAQHARRLIVTSPATVVDADAPNDDVESESDPDTDGAEAAAEENIVDSREPVSLGIDQVLTAAGKPLLYALVGAVATALALRRTSTRS